MPSAEQDSIAKLCHSAPHPFLDLGTGDDAALISVPDGMQLAISTDTYCEGTHFLPGTDPFDIGYKALAVNLSDMAAMGAEPQFVTAALAMPKHDHDWLAKYCDGIFALAEQFNVSLIGGDLTKGPLSTTLTIHGFLPKGKALLMTGAKAGDLIGLTGKTGRAAAGLNALQNKIESPYTEQFNRPAPRINAGIQLRDIAHSCTDVSDGLFEDLKSLLNKSKVGAEINCDTLASEIDLETVLCGGEDYELLFTYPADKKPELDCEWTCIGNITESLDLIFKKDGRPFQFNDQTYQHF